MATARNPITGQLIKTKHNSSEYQTGYDRIFGNKKKEQPVQQLEQLEQLEQQEAEVNSKEQQ